MSLYQSLATLSGVEPIPGVRPRFFHLVNPFTPKTGSEHENAQRVTFECIRHARRCFEEGSVEVVSVVFPEDAAVVPGDFVCASVLTRSIADLIESPRRLPLLFDILDAPLPGGEAAEDDYIIYTNIDIAPMPSFYRFVHEVAIRGFDAFAINRRTVDAQIGTGSDFGMMHCEIGTPHPGTDCLVFRRAFLDKFVKSECCLGVTAVMKSLLYNLAAVSKQMVIFKDAHATFHLGDDRQWSDPAFQPLSDHNKSEAVRVVNELITRSSENRKNLEWFATERQERGLLRLLGLEERSGKRVGGGRRSSGEDRATGEKKNKEAAKVETRGRKKPRVTKRMLEVFGRFLGRKPKPARSGRVQADVELSPAHRLNSGESKLAKEANLAFLKSGIADVRLLDYLIDPVPLVVDAELSRGRSAPVYGFGRDALHPFVTAARVALDVPESQRRSKIGEVMELYYRTVRPSSFEELAGVRLGAEFQTLPSYAFVFPWERSSPSEKVYRMSNFAAKENSRCGLNEGTEAGCTWVGPVSAGKLDVETGRLHDLLGSILTKGYLRSDAKDGDIRGLILMNSPGEWKWIATGGQHRACVLSALGNANCPLRVRGIVRRDDVSAWPNVVRGVYSEEQALVVFDRVFRGDYGHLGMEWGKLVVEKGWV